MKDYILGLLLGAVLAGAGGLLIFAFVYTPPNTTHLFMSGDAMCCHATGNHRLQCGRLELWHPTNYIDTSKPCEAPQ